MTTSEANQAPSAPSTDSADAVVIGAGVIGSAITLELTRKGLNVICVDKLPAAGYGSTSSSVAIIRFHYSTASGVAMAWEAMHWWKDWANHVASGDHDDLARFVNLPMVIPVMPDEPRPRYLTHFDDLGIPYRQLNIAEAVIRWPGLEFGQFGPPVPLEDTDAPFWGDPHGIPQYIMVSEDAGYITDPALAAQNMAAAARAEGARFRFKTRVTAITNDNNRITGVELDDGTTITTPIVVNAGGPHSSLINDLAGASGDMARQGRALRREVYHAHSPIEGFDTNGCIMGDMDTGIYARPEPGNNLIVGSTEPECDPLIWVDDPDTLDETLTEDDFQLHMLRLARRFPDLGIPHSKQGLVSMYDATADWTPIYDRSSIDGYYMACGTSGNQFKNAPVAGWLMAELITAVEAGHDHDAEPLKLVGPVTGMEIDLFTFSRLRPVDESAGTTVMG